jgi:hypothetical protein
MMYRKVIAVCSEIHTKHINTLCGQNVELLKVKPGGTYSDHWALKCLLKPKFNRLVCIYVDTDMTVRPIKASHVFAVKASNCT